jgi:hypothetical protein
VLFLTSQGLPRKEGKMKYTAAKLLALLKSLPNDEQEKFVKLCWRDGKNGVRQALQRQAERAGKLVNAAAARGFNGAAIILEERAAELKVKAARADRLKNTGKPEKRALLSELSKQGLTQGQIARHPKVVEMNGGEVKEAAVKQMLRRIRRVRKDL